MRKADGDCSLRYLLTLETLTAGILKCTKGIVSLWRMKQERKGLGTSLLYYTRIHTFDRTLEGLLKS